MNKPANQQPWVAVAALACCAAALAGCGTSTPLPLAPASSTRLRHDLALISAAVDGGNRDLALQRISAIRGDIGRLQTAGKLDAADAAVLRLDAMRLGSSVRAHLAGAAQPERGPAPASRSGPGKPPPKPHPPAPGPQGHGDGPPGHGPGHRQGPGRRWTRWLRALIGGGDGGD